RSRWLRLLRLRRACWLWLLRLCAPHLRLLRLRISLRRRLRVLRSRLGLARSRLGLARLRLPGLAWLRLPGLAWGTRRRLSWWVPRATLAGLGSATRGQPPRIRRIDALGLARGLIPLRQ